MPDLVSLIAGTYVFMLIALIIILKRAPIIDMQGNPVEPENAVREITTEYG